MGELSPAFGVSIGDVETFSKTITEVDIALFSAVSGDFDPIHVNEAYALSTSFGHRIAHGLGVLALLSATESSLSRRAIAKSSEWRPVSLGYDHTRFVKPVFIGDTLIAYYRVSEIDKMRCRTIANCKINNHAGETCLVTQHIMKWVSNDDHRESE